VAVQIRRNIPFRKIPFRILPVIPRFHSAAIFRKLPLSDIPHFTKALYDTAGAWFNDARTPHFTRYPALLTRTELPAL